MGVGVVRDHKGAATTCKIAAKPYIRDPIVAEAMATSVAVDSIFDIRRCSLEVVKALRCEEINYVAVNS